MSQLAHRSRPRLTLFLATALVMSLAARATGQEEPRWPREFSQKDGSKLTVFQPQVDEWQGYRKLKARAAVAFEIPGQDQPVIGSVLLTADTETDHETRVVMVDDVKIVKADFPGQTDSRAKALTTAVRTSVPRKGMEVPLDRILANLERGKALAKEVKLSNKPPKVIVSRKAAILVVLDGKPMLEPITGTELSTVLNTSSDLFRHHKTNRFYLLDDDSWLMAEELTGAWVAAGALPADFRKLPQQERWTEVRKNLPGMALTGADVPVVYVAEEPTELIVTLGEPQFKPIPGTKLLYVANTESDVFLCGSDGKYYTLISGRWFRSLGKDLPVQYCSQDLPSDFAHIPEDHTCGRVLVSVPGTQQAQEAVYAAQIPRQAKVDRGQKLPVEVTYTGEPEFSLIDGTKVEVATNTSFDVFRVSGRYYVCYQAVWFESATAKGPWAVCVKVPAEIYQIPAESDKYNVTYVEAYEPTDDYVTYGYYPGYYGCYPWRGVMHHGCGYYWHHNHAYYRHRYQHWHHHRGHHHQTYGHGHYYDHLDGRFHSHRDARRNAGRVAASPYQTWGKGVTPRRSANRSVAARNAGARPVGGAGTARKPGMDLHVGKDGGVYRRQGNGWQRYNKGGWQQVSKQPAKQPARRPAKQPTRQPAKQPTRQPARQPPSSDTTGRESTLNRSHRSRSQGSQRSSQYRSYRSSRGSRTGGSRGGGSRGGGGRR